MIVLVMVRMPEWLSSKIVWTSMFKSPLIRNNKADFIPTVRDQYPSTLMIVLVIFRFFLKWYELCWNLLLPWETILLSWETSMHLLFQQSEFIMKYVQISYHEKQAGIVYTLIQQSEINNHPPSWLYWWLSGCY
jgi:hypothetical protein